MELTDFSAKCNARTGILSGKMTFFTEKADGRVKKVNGKFSGIVMGGSGYGTVVTKEGTWAVKIAVCGGCGD